MVTKAKDIVELVFKKFGFSSRTQDIFEAWASLDRAITLDSELCEVCRGVLYVKVRSPMAFNSLYYNKRKIIHSLNARLKEKVVKDIKFEMAL